MVLFLFAIRIPVLWDDPFKTLTRRHDSIRTYILRTYVREQKRTISMETIDCGRRTYLTRLKFNLRETCNACSLIIHESRVLTVVTGRSITADLNVALRNCVIFTFYYRHTDRTIHLRMRKLIE